MNSDLGIYPDNVRDEILRGAIQRHRTTESGRPSTRYSTHRSKKTGSRATENRQPALRSKRAIPGAIVAKTPSHPRLAAATIREGTKSRARYPNTGNRIRTDHHQYA